MPETSASTRKSVPFQIGNGPSLTGPRLGGPAPIGVSPANSALTYLATIPFRSAAGTEASIFLDQSNDFIFGGNAGTILDDSRLETILHPQSRRSEAGRAWDSALSSHPLVFGPEGDDATLQDGEVVPYSGHKLRGVPYLVARAGRLENDVARLLGRGFRQVLQLDFPGHLDAAVSGDWPFGTGLFHLFVSAHNPGIDWAYFWEA